MLIIRQLTHYYKRTGTIFAVLWLANFLKEQRQTNYQSNLKLLTDNQYINY